MLNLQLLCHKSAVCCEYVQCIIELTVDLAFGFSVAMFGGVCPPMQGMQKVLGCLPFMAVRI